MSSLSGYLEGVSTVAIAGHVNPDGDCIGSCMGIWLYLRDNFPDLEADVYMQKPPRGLRLHRGAGPHPYGM